MLLVTVGRRGAGREARGGGGNRREKREIRTDRGRQKPTERNTHTHRNTDGQERQTEKD